MAPRSMRDGTQFAEVRVDADVGEIRVSRFVGAFDAGRVMNAKTARSQLIGGIVYGLGMALLEETHVDAETGRIVNANIAEYLVPVNADVPDIKTIIVPNDELVSNPLGAKGIGELPMVGVAAAQGQSYGVCRCPRSCPHISLPG
jgi:xanthine dehydrogenase YagR molybdenum-binding subunit